MISMCKMINNVPVWKIIKIVFVFEPLLDLLACLAKDVQNLSN